MKFVKLFLAARQSCTASQQKIKLKINKLDRKLYYLFHLVMSVSKRKKKSLLRGSVCAECIDNYFQFNLLLAFVYSGKSAKVRKDKWIEFYEILKQGEHYEI